MKLKIRTFLILSFLFVVGISKAQLRNISFLSDTEKEKPTYAEPSEGTWWGYFNGDYSTVKEQGLGTGMAYPLTYNCAIKIEKGDPEVLGKKIKALKFAFFYLNNIEDVKIWVSTILPLTADDADICCQNVDVSSLVTIEGDGAINEVCFDTPYQLGSTDVYVGYSFTVTSILPDKNTYPVVVTDSTTSENAFFLSWGKGWKDLVGNEFGDLAIMLMLGEGDFIKGDANYDMKVNVGDVSSTIEYIMSGNVTPFNKDMADIDGNGEINIVDVASICDIILGKYINNSNANNLQESNETILKTKTQNGVSLSLISNNTYKAFQMDITLPINSEINTLEINKKIFNTHSVRYSKIKEGKYRVVAYSIGGSCFDKDIENLITIDTDADDIKVDNIIFATSDLTEKRFETTSNTTDVKEVCIERDNEEIYNIEGKKMGITEPITKGLYIVNGRKVVIK